MGRSHGDVRGHHVRVTQLAYVSPEVPGAHAPAREVFPRNRGDTRAYPRISHGHARVGELRHTPAYAQRADKVPAEPAVEHESIEVDDCHPTEAASVPGEERIEGSARQPAHRAKAKAKSESAAEAEERYIRRRPQRTIVGI